MRFNPNNLTYPQRRLFVGVCFILLVSLIAFVIMTLTSGAAGDNSNLDSGANSKTSGDSSSKDGTSGKGGSSSQDGGNPNGGSSTGGATSSGQNFDGSTTTFGLSSAPQLDASGLAKFMLTEIPDGFVVGSDEKQNTGPISLDKAVRDNSDNSEYKALLERAGFVQGYSRYWKDSSGTEVFIYLYEFATDDGAQQHEIDFRTNGSKESTRFGTNSIPGGVGFTDGDGGTFAQVSFAKGKFDVQVEVVKDSSSKTQTLANKIGQLQYAKLPDKD